MSVLPPGNNTPAGRSKAEQFLSGGIRTLRVLGVPAQMVVRVGKAQDEIASEATGGCDMLVLGAPLADREGKVTLNGLVGHVLNAAPERVTLIVRSNYAATQGTALGFTSRVNLIEEDVL